MSRLPVLAVPCCEPGRGGGHLVRCVTLVRDLRSLGREAYLFIARNNEIADRLIAETHFDTSWIIKNSFDPDSAPGASYPGTSAAFSIARNGWECVILDNFQTQTEEFSRWEKIAPLIGIDEGGPCRNKFNFLIDILPGITRHAAPPNISDPSLLPLPEKTGQQRSRTNGTPLKVLVSFGQEDSAGLGLACARALADAVGKANSILDITLLSGRAAEAEQGRGFTVRANIPRLSEHLKEYDLLITHYGITAFEALYSNIPAALVSPDPYHEKLANATGFFSAGAGHASAKKLAGLLIARNAVAVNESFLDDLKKKCAALAARHNLDKKPERSLAALVNSFELHTARDCRACGAPANGKIIARYPERSFRQCPSCGVISMDRLTPPPVEYAKDYFFDFYKKQYGKTYIEDFPNLVNMGAKRIARLKKLLPRNSDNSSDSSNSGSTHENAKPKPRLFDIGCAYGAFLVAARDAGFSPLGIDPAEDAVEYVRGQLGLEAYHGIFPRDKPPAENKSENKPSNKYDAITLWYVIEHFPDCAAALAEIKHTLKPGGILAFATPSYTGISGRASIRDFLEHSPADHWTIWPATARQQALKKAGFTIKKTVSTGHHPERFPLPGKNAPPKKGALYAILLAASKIFSLGDTFEVYAKRK
ncbi:MAG TPA: hypothetical protein DEQ14_02340 [Treponema sp.]|nr:hypothetical protein [Treponema sp.]